MNNYQQEQSPAVRQSSMSRNPYANISLPFTCVSSTLTQVPTTSNGHTAVATSSVETQGLSITEFGVANPESAGTADTKTIIEAARLESQQRVVALAGQFVQQISANPPKPMKNITPEENAFDGGRRPLPKGIPSGNGGGTKPASAKQIALIKDICAQQGQDAVRVCEQLCGRKPVNLQGVDANFIIQHMNAQKKKHF